MRLREIQCAVRPTRWAGIGLAVVLFGVTAGADDPPNSDRLRLHREIQERVDSLRRETEALRTRLEEREADLRRLEAVQIQLIVLDFKERAERNWQEQMRKRDLREELRRSTEPDFTVRKL